MGSIGTEDLLREASAAPVENGAVGDQFPVLPDRVKKTSGQLNGDVPAAKLPNGHHHPVTKVADAPAPPIEYPTSAWRPKLELEDRGIDEIRPLRVVVVGAGLSGILAGILLPAKVPGLDLTIYEKNADVVCFSCICSCPRTSESQSQTDISNIRAARGWRMSTLA